MAELTGKSNISPFFSEYFLVAIPTGLVQNTEKRRVSKSRLSDPPLPFFKINYVKLLT